MKKVTAIVLATITGLTAFNANADFFAPTNFTIKFGLGTNNLGSSLEKIGYAPIEVKKLEKTRFNPYFGLEADYGVVGTNILYAGLSYRSSNGDYTYIKDSKSTTLVKSKSTVSGTNVYTGLRVPFAQEGALYATVATGFQLSNITSNFDSKAKKVENETFLKKIKSSFYAQAGIGYSIQNWSFEANYFLSTTKFKSTPPALVFSVGYTF